MVDTTQVETSAKPGGNLRGAVLWTAGILLALGLVWFVAAVVVPVYMTRAAVRDYQHPSAMPDELVQRLGGAERARARLRLFVRLPEWVVSDMDRFRAAEVLGTLLEWEQACNLYRTTPFIPVKEGLLTRVFEELRPSLRQAALRKADILARFGEPDAVWSDGAEFIYTGRGQVGDNSGGYILTFDAEGRLIEIVAA